MRINGTVKKANFNKQFTNATGQRTLIINNKVLEMSVFSHKGML